MINDCHGEAYSDGRVCLDSEAFEMLVRARRRRNDERPIKVIDHITGRTFEVDPYLF